MKMKELKPFNNMPSETAVLKAVQAVHPGYTARKVNNIVKKRMEYLRGLAEALPRNCVEIEIVWKKSRTWGWCPSQWSAKAWYEGPTGKDDVYDSAGKYYTYAEGGHIGGCGYCKRSTATAYALNAVLMAWLFRLNPKAFTQEKHPNGFVKSGMPYGISNGLWSGVTKMWTMWDPTFSGGVGYECHEGIIRHLGGEIVMSHPCGERSNTDLFRYKLPPFKQPKPEEVTK